MTVDPAYEAPGAAWKRADVAVAFAEDRRQLLPQIEVQESLIRDLITRQDRRVESFCDLGCGDGALSELVLDAFPIANAVLVDFSEPMLERLKERLRDASQRWQANFADLSESSWLDGLAADSRFDLIVSGFCIHHLPHERKRELYEEIFDLLTPGGLFLNWEHVASDGLSEGIFEEYFVNRLIELEQFRDNPRSDREVEREYRERDDAEHDMPLSDITQCQWLEEIGYEDVDIHYKWVGLSLFGGVSPAKKGADSGTV